MVYSLVQNVISKEWMMLNYGQKKNNINRITNLFGNIFYILHLNHIKNGFVFLFVKKMKIKIIIIQILQNV